MIVVRVVVVVFGELLLTEKRIGKNKKKRNMKASNIFSDVSPFSLLLLIHLT